MPLLRRNSAQHQAARIPPGAGADDVALVAAAGRDPHDFAPLFLRYWDPVLRFCTVRLHDHHDAEDAASQVFVDAYASLHRFQDRGGAGSFRSWLFTIAHHEIANRHRYRVRHPASPLEEVEESIRTDPIVEQVETSDERARVVALVQELPDRPREVVELRLAGLTDREIAEVLGISGQAVRQAQSRAVALLRVRMGVASQAKRNPHG
jgi:RNA polymerase sigma-70 factor (ECF subfamily)